MHTIKFSSARCLSVDEREHHWESGSEAKRRCKNELQHAKKNERKPYGERDKLRQIQRKQKRGEEEKKQHEQEERSKTEIDDTKNKLKCNLVSMNFVGSFPGGRAYRARTNECINF